MHIFKVLPGGYFSILFSIALSQCMNGALAIVVIV